MTKKWSHRGHARYDVSLRVEYDAGGRRILAFSRDLSRGGMLLRGAEKLEVGLQLPFKVFLHGSVTPLQIFGRVVQLSRQGAHVQFLPDQEGVASRLRSYELDTVLPALQAAAMGPKATVRQVCDLVMMLAANGRPDEGLQVMRQGSKTWGTHKTFCETWASLLLGQLAANPPRPDRRQLLAELGQLCDNAGEFAHSPALLAARDLVHPPAPNATPSKPPASARPAGEDRHGAAAEAKAQELLHEMQGLRARLAQVERELTAAKEATVVKGQVAPPAEEGDFTGPKTEEVAMPPKDGVRR